ncbi:hypothetical protein BURCENK562V_C1564 [Burkholderia cenocepacia K56-2Valvano]|nr:hypothetical protein BURCENK562V_C1564 [Burkholderia cenocepacia K56-2Valvano]
MLWRPPRIARRHGSKNIATECVVAKPLTYQRVRRIRTNKWCFALRVS